MTLTQVLIDLTQSIFNSTQNRSNSSLPLRTNHFNNIQDSPNSNSSPLSETFVFINISDVPDRPNSSPPLRANPSSSSPPLRTNNFNNVRVEDSLNPSILSIVSETFV